ncbi:PapB/FocB family fimbrial expression transcriptional regulator, partial [Escherichia coli]
MIPLEAGRDYSSFKEREKYEFRVKNISLIPGKMPEDFFEILIELSAIHSQKIINALRDYLVSGDTRKVS